MLRREVVFPSEDFQRRRNDGDRRAVVLEAAPDFPAIKTVVIRFEAVAVYLDGVNQVLISPVHLGDRRRAFQGADAIVEI